MVIGNKLRGGSLQGEEQVAVAVVDFDTAIEKTGHGCYHLLVVIAGSVCMLAAGFENALTAYILPSAKCDLQITTEGMGVLNILFMAGSISSAYVCGALADVCGRKVVLVVSLALDALVLFVSSFSQSLNVLLVCRFLSGFLSGVPASLSIPYVGEFHARRNQKTSLCYVGFFWALSWMLAPGIAWLVIPLDMATLFSNIPFNSWRMFVALFAVPSSIGAILVGSLPETPRFLLAAGKTEEAHEVLKKMFALNTRKSAEEYPITLGQLFCATETVALEEGGDAVKIGKGRSMATVAASMWRQTKELMRPPYLFYSCICAALMASNMFGGYGFGLWLPELIKRFEDHHTLFPNLSVSVCNTVLRQPQAHSPRSDLSPVNLTELQVLSTAQCNNKLVNDRVFRSTLIIGSACLFGDIFYGLVANRVSHKVILAVPMLVAAVCSTLIYFAHTSTMVLVISCIFQAGVELVYFGIYTVVMESFPTRIRALAMCFTVLSGRISAVVINVLFGELFDAHCEVPIFITAGVLLVGVLLGLMVPSKQPSEVLSVKSRTTGAADDDCCDTHL